jgi:hypothetical protein
MKFLNKPLQTEKAEKTKELKIRETVPQININKIERYLKSIENTIKSTFANLRESYPEINSQLTSREKNLLKSVKKFKNELDNLKKLS